MTPSELPDRRRAEIPNLRPPTLMIDLLFGALMLFAFQMGNPNAREIVPYDFDLPTAEESRRNEAKTLLPLRPFPDGKGGWVYGRPEGGRLSAEEVATAVQRENVTPVLLVPRTSRVQNYLDAEQPLRARGLKAGLAVGPEIGSTE